MSSLIDEFAAYLRAAGRSERTISSYLDVLRVAARITSRDPSSFTTADILLTLVTAPSPGTKRARWTALKAWHKWLVRTGYRSDNPLDRVDPPRTPRNMPRPLSDEQVARLLSMRMHSRTRVILHLALYAGLRASEIARVRGEDIDIDAGIIRVRGKGGVDALLPLHPVLRDIARKMPRAGWWFPRHDRPGEPMTRAGVTSVCRTLMRRAGIREGSCHRLRHTYATRLFAAGVDIRVVQELLRHASIATTQIYVQVPWQQKIDALNRLIA